MICEYCFDTFPQSDYSYYDYINSSKAVFCSSECYDKFTQDRIEDLNYERNAPLSARQKVK